MLNVKTFVVVVIGVIVAAIVGVGIVMGQGTSACVTGGAVPSGNTGLVADCEALLAMKTALRGSGKLNWWTGRSIEKWDGIKVQSDRVAELSLPNRSLDGVLPAGLGSLSALKTLDLSSNSLTGQIPASLNNLTLNRLRLGGNSLTGCVPANLLNVADSDVSILNLPSCGGTTTPATPTATPLPSSASTPTPTPPPSGDRVTAIEGRLTDIERRLTALEADVARLMATPVPVPSPTPEPTPIPNLGTQQMPIPFGTTFKFRNSATDHWEFTILETTPDATSAILDHNQFNDPPESGNQFYMVKVRAKYLGADSERFGGNYRLKALGDAAVVYTWVDDCAYSIPNRLSNPELFKNGQIEGNVCWEIASSDADSLVLIVEPDSSREGSRVWFSLTPSP